MKKLINKKIYRIYLIVVLVVFVVGTIWYIKNGGDYFRFTFFDKILL
ncbi:hypothetical protein AB996_1214 [Lactococcus cremoris]|uniref:Uncharacterized protein n=1 Tax=Lactococcus lactis subsp. cremoris TaxID=1359 RepID=A0A166JN63_LACLC|nr:hypothetical protein AB996_1214 [Lactococcus cremoris]